MLRHGYSDGAAVRALPTTRDHNGVAVAWLVGLFLMTICFAFPGAAHSATYYVSVSGSDSASGTSSAPWRTIQYSVGAVSPGDTVLINDGTYSESVHLDNIKQGTSPITFQAVNPRKAIISPGGSNGIDCQGAPKNIRFVGLKLLNGRCGYEFGNGCDGLEFNNVEISGFIEGLRVRTGANLKIYDCYVHDNQNGVLLGVKDVSGIQTIDIERTTSCNNAYGGNQDSFMIEGMCTNVTIRDCLAYGASDTGFDIKPDNTILERCRSYNNVGWGFKLWGNNDKVVNCISYSNTNNNFGCSGSGLQFIGCTIGPSGSDGMRLETTSISTVTIRDCIFYNSDLYCFASSLPNEDYNCYYSTSGSYVIRLGGTTYTPAQVQAHAAGIGAHDIGKDPMCVAPGSANFALSTGSPCIGAGIANSLLTVDYNNKTRLNPPDIGAIAAKTGNGTPTVPTAPTKVTISNGSTAGTDNDLTAVATGSTVSSGTITYQYQWARSTDGGSTWTAWGWPGATLSKSALVDGQTWKARACATVDGTNLSGYTESATCTISTGVATLAPPTAVTVTPTSPSDSDNLIATATGGGTAGTTPSYEYQWAKSTDGTTWSAWGNSGSVLLASATTPGDKWKAEARATDGTAFSPWTVSAVVTIAGGGTGTTVPAPTSVTITPSGPTDSDNLLAAARGGGLASTDTYQTQWARSTNGGSTWGAWSGTSASLPAASTFPGDSWKAHMRVAHGTDYSAWTESQVVTIPGTSGGGTVKAPTALVVTPSSPKDSSNLVATASPTAPTGVTYTYQWCKSTDGGATWSAWGNSGRTVSASLTAPGDQWQARVRAGSGTTYSAWVVSNTVTIPAATSTTGIKITISPSSPADSQDLVANATGTYKAGQTLYYEYYWSRSTDGGATWTYWNWQGKTLPASTTSVGDKWRVLVRGHDGQTWGADVIGPTVTIH